MFTVNHDIDKRKHHKVYLIKIMLTLFYFFVNVSQMQNINVKTNNEKQTNTTEFSLCC